MSHAKPKPIVEGSGFPPYLAVDRFLTHETEARALAYALERGLVDRLAAAPTGVPSTRLASELHLPDARMATFVGLLASGGVVVVGADGLVSLAPGFRDILPYRDLLDAKLAFAARASEDLRNLFPDFIGDLPAFMAGSRTFELFRYDRCFEVTPENLAATRRWVEYTTCLTRYEAGPGLDRIDLAAHRRMLDLGGNSGEFAAQACTRVPALEATVFDLPVVCALGRENLMGRPEASRVRFRAGDMRLDPLPGGRDLVTFKSVLHDWPADDATRLLGRAAAALAPGGTLVIYERARLPLGTRRVDYAMSANLVFEPFFRDAAFYREALSGLGLTVVEAGTVELETPFHLIVATKEGARG